MAEEQKSFQVLYDYTDVPTLKKFTMSNKRVRCAMGPFGCVAGDTLVLTEEGPLRISDIVRPMQILTWDGNMGQFRFSQSGGAFPKGKDYLYRVSTPQGSFEAAGHHHVFCGDNMYRPVSSLRVGDILSGGLLSHLQKFVLDGQLLLPEGDPRYSEKVSDLMGRYAESARQYGRKFLLAANTSPAFFPTPAGAQRLSLPCDLFGAVRKDAPPGQLPKRTRLDLFSFQKQTDGFYHHAVRPDQVGQETTFRPLVSHISEKVLPFWQFLLKSVPRRTVQLFSQLIHSSPSSLSEWSILSIERKDVKEIFWDMQVLDTNNYVTADGTIHHNSGKSSACVFDIIRRAHEQVPGPDGIRRSRCAIVRNSYIQLRDTTIRTFHDWFPPKLFGEYRVTDHTYIITKFPGVHLEVLFRALDRPDQVSNLLSLEVTSAWFNEAREIPRTIIEAMDARIGRYPSKRDGGPSWYGIIMDTNPPDEDSYLYKMFEKVRPANWQIFKQPSGLSAHAENTKHLPKNYYQNLAVGKDEMYVRIYIHGQYGYLVSGKPVFQSFSDNIHVAPHQLEPIKGLDVLLGFDFGLQPAVAIGQITPLGQLRILDELVSDGMGLRQFCENQLIPLLRNKYFGMNVAGYGDPSGTSRMPTDESTCFEVLQGPDVGLRNVVPAPTNAILPRVSAVETFLNKMYKGEPGFLLSPNCHYLRKALNGGYHYEKDPKSMGEEFKVMPVKNFSSHIADALQMLCMYMTEKEISDKRWKSFVSTLKQKTYRPASAEAGY
jgi:hypothetical protein